MMKMLISWDLLAKAQHASINDLRQLVLGLLLVLNARAASIDRSIDVRRVDTTGVDTTPSSLIGYGTQPRLCIDPANHPQAHAQAPSPC